MEIDNIKTHDFRVGELNASKNVLLNKKEGNLIEVVLTGADVRVGELVLLTLSSDKEVETAWKVTSIEPHEQKVSFKCVLNFEGTITP